MRTYTAASLEWGAVGEGAGGSSTTISESWELAGGSTISELWVPVKEWYEWLCTARERFR